MDTDKIIATAKATAHDFAAEFPGETISGDWDATAWETDGPECSTAEERREAWPIYMAALHAEVRRLARAAA